MDDENKSSWQLYYLVGAATFTAIALAGISRVNNAKKSTLYSLPYDGSMKGRKVVITGGNSGIGLAVAKGILHRGADVVIGCRNIEEGKSLAENLKKSAPPGVGTIEAKQLDLTNFNSIANFADEIDVCNVLINNAGQLIMISCATQVLINIYVIYYYFLSNEGTMKGRCELVEVKKGVKVECTMLTNHLGPLYLTSCLLPKLVQSSSEVSIDYSPKRSRK
jgi:NAD(P)-dependent dehydrogenase (short-subunit alcohol dehydrogenase family)